MRSEGKIAKARKVLNMMTCVGNRKGGTHIATNNMIHCTREMPTL